MLNRYILCIAHFSFDNKQHTHTKIFEQQYILNFNDLYLY